MTGTRTLAVGCGVGPPWIWLVLVHPADDQLGLDPVDFEQFLCCGGGIVLLVAAVVAVVFVCGCI